jgi:O-antigen/teichoic acid export membrane protein
LKVLTGLNSIKAIQLYQLFRFAAVFITGVILAQKGFSTEEISHYETFLFISYAASFFWLSGITNSFLSLFPKTNGNDTQTLIFNTALLLVAASVVAGFFVALLSWSSVIHAGYWKLIVFYLLLTIPSYLNEYILLVHEKNKQLITYGIVSFLLHVILIIVAIFIQQQVEMVLWALMLISAIKFVFLIFLLINFSVFKINISHIQLLVASSLPLALSYLLSGSAEVIDGFLVKNYFNEGDFAIFRYGARELPVVLLMANAFSSAAIPKVAANLDEGLELIRKNSLQLFNYFFPVTVLLMFFSKQLFVYVFSGAFAQSAFIFNVYLLLIISRLLFPQTILNGIGKNRFLMVSAFFEVIVNVAASILLMQKFGLPGIAMGTVIANIFDKLLLIAYCKFRLKIEPERYISVFQHFFFSFMLLVIAYLLSL